MRNPTTEIIIAEFDNRFRWQGGEPFDTAMIVSFELEPLDGQEWFLQMMLWGPHNYVNVFYRIIPSSDLRNPIIGGEHWHLCCYHDSCWRSDGVERTLQRFEPVIKQMDTFWGSLDSHTEKQGWYRTYKLDEDQQNFLMDINRRRYTEIGVGEYNEQRADIIKRYEALAKTRDEIVPKLENVCLNMLEELQIKDAGQRNVEHYHDQITDILKAGGYDVPNLYEGAEE